MTLNTLPDFETNRRRNQGVPVLDSGEAAARLGSPVTWHRSGYVLHFTSFDNGLSDCIVDILDGTPTFNISTEKSRTPPFSFAVNLSGDADDELRISKTFVVNTPTNIGVEGHILIPQDIDWVSLKIDYAANDKIHRHRVKLDIANSLISIQNSGDTFTSIGTISLDANTDNLFIPVKLVIDGDDHVYKFAKVGQTTFDISGIEGFTQNFTTFNLAAAGFQIKGTATSTGTVFIDDLIITLDE